MSSFFSTEHIINYVAVLSAIISTLEIGHYHYLKVKEPYIIIFYLYYLYICIVVFLKAAKSAYRNSFVYWYTGLDKSLPPDNWDHIRQILHNEPIEQPKKFSLYLFFISLYKATLISSITLIIPYTVYSILSSNNIRSVIGELQSSTITVIVGISTGLIAYYYNSRLSARTSNRVRWIQDLRNEMTHFFGTIGYIDDHRPLYDGEVVVKITKEFGHKKKLKKEEIEYESKFKSMSKLELLINPSEKLHRSLIALMRFLFGISYIEVDKIVFENLGYRFCTPYKGSIRKKDKKSLAIAHWPNKTDRCIINFYNEKNESTFLEYDVLLSQVFRIATAILKTEWEQVKSLH